MANRVLAYSLKSIPNFCARTLSTTASKHGADLPSPKTALSDPHKGKVFSKDTELPDELGLAVGAERWEMLAKIYGDDDPFDMRVLKMNKGTKTEPNLIPSFTDERLVGCVCYPESITINWMWVREGEQKRCQCGYWFKLVDKPMIDYSAL